MSFSGRTKSTSSFDARTKNTSSFAGRVKNILAYARSLIVTDSLDRILVGENEDEVLIWTADTSGWDGRTKHTP
jgi:hypothetical protein